MGLFPTVLLEFIQYVIHCSEQQDCPTQAVPGEPVKEQVNAFLPRPGILFYPET